MQCTCGAACPLFREAHPLPIFDGFTDDEVETIKNAGTYVTIPADFPPGTYPLRIEVDGARSALALDPVTQAYATPSLEVTE